MIGLTERKVAFFTLKELVKGQMNSQLNDGYTVCRLGKDNVSDIRINEPFRTDCFGITIVLKGAMRLRIGFTEHELHRNMAFLYSPRTIVEFLEMDKDIEIITFMLSFDFVKEMGLYFKGHSSLDFLFDNYLKVFALNEEMAKRFVVYLEHLHELNLLKMAIRNQQEIVNHTCSLISYELETILMREMENNLFVGGRKGKLCMDFVALVMEQFKEERSVQYYADSLFVSRKYLSRIVKEVTGMSPIEIIEQTVMTEIVPRLRSNIYSISDIVQYFNFTDMPTFSKFVKKNIGVSPTAYRKEFRVTM